MQVQQRLQLRALVCNRGNAIQPHLVIHTQQAAFADVGHTADPLGALADELEHGWRRWGLAAAAFVDEWEDVAAAA